MDKNREIAISARNVKKQYQLGVIGTTTLKRDLQSRWAKFRGKEDPNLKIGHQHVEGDTLFALNGVSFDIYKGERIGIIGHNGAGKSTLLKLLCRITSPSDGYIGYNGKVTSMLEVGTGFHPELTGRENIYMNGAILGMSRKEVSECFDEIVEFSEVGEFIDTPVKRYSSGMYVRLAFAVAAHLNSDIVIMDEVLAVGDVGFQEKCIQRMRDIAEDEKRTILYVSHNMSTIHALCDRCFVMQDGKIVFEGDTHEAEQYYRKTTASKIRTYSEKQGMVEKRKIQMLHAQHVEGHDINKENTLKIKLNWRYEDDLEDTNLRVIFRNQKGPFATKLFMNLGPGKKGEVREEIFEVDISSFQNGSYGTRYVFFNVDSMGNSVQAENVWGISFDLSREDNDSDVKWDPMWWGAIRLK